MSQRPTTIIAHHLILTLYGHWGANDPRGSMSADFHDEKFKQLGPIHFGREADEQQPTRNELRSYHRDHQALLNFPLFWMDDAKKQAVAEAFAETVSVRRYTCYACAILANHAHLIIRIHRDRADAMLDQLMQGSRTKLHRFADVGERHPVWSSRPYVKFLYAPDHVRRCISYIEQNPPKEGLPLQHHPFVKAYDNWPHHKTNR